MSKEVLLVVESVSNEKGVPAGVIFEALELAYFAKEKAQQFDQVGLPDPAVMEIKQKPASDDVPMLEGQKPAATPADVPAAPEQK